MPPLDKTQHFYPDLIAAGGLDVALSASLLGVGSTLTASGLPENIKFVAYSHVKHGNRFSQVNIAANERLFVFDFWSEGVHIANGKMPDIVDSAKAINAWVAAECSLVELSSYAFVSLTKQALSHENGTMTEERWISYLGTIADDFPELKKFVASAAQAPQLRQLFPYTSMNRFCFSRCTGFLTQATLLSSNLSKTVNMLSVLAMALSLVRMLHQMQYNLSLRTCLLIVARQFGVLPKPLI